MIYTDMTRKAMQIAYRAHEGQVDKGNTPYIFHPLHVANQMDTEETTAIALLHDVLEDSDITPQELLSEGISEAVVSSVLLLTRRNHEPYQDYISKVIASGDRNAMSVKLEDLNHNLDTSRVERNQLPESMIRRYQKAKMRILDALNTEVSQN